MSAVIQCPTSTCSASRVMTGARSRDGNPHLELCYDCRKREAEWAVLHAKGFAFDAARDRYGLPGEATFNMVRNAEHHVLVRLACRGSTELDTLANLKRYWDAVKAEVES